MACRGIVKLRRGLLLWPLVGLKCATARRASVSLTEVSKNRIHGSNANSLCQSPLVADENPENIRIASMMDDCNARALTPMRKSLIAVLSSRLFFKMSPSASTSKGFLIVGTIGASSRREFQKTDFDCENRRSGVDGERLLLRSNPETSADHEFSLAVSARGQNTPHPRRVR